MPLNNSIAETATSGGFGELGYAPGKPAAERDSVGGGVLVRRLLETLIPKLLLGVLNAAKIQEVARA